MFRYPHINPVAFKVGPVTIFGKSIGPLAVHWYGIMYIIGFLAAWFLAQKQNKRTHAGFSKEQISDMLFYGAIGVLVGGRVGYMLFYAFPVLMHHPLSLFEVWDGGMSFHGGLLGVICAIWLYSLKLKKPFFHLIDFAAPLVPIGLGAGRIGNFINGELWGRVTHVPWAMIYPQAGNLPRHPSEIYEFLGEGIILFLLLWWFSGKRPPRRAVSGLFLLGYGIIRFCLEFFRQPDPQLGFVAFGWMTRGQELCIPMILFGGLLLFLAYRKKKATQTETTQQGVI